MNNGHISNWEDQTKIWTDILQNYSMLGHNQVSYSLNDNLIYFVSNLKQTFQDN